MLTSRQTEVPPTKGAAIQTWMHEVCRCLPHYQTHILSIAHPHLPRREFHRGVYYHRIRIGRVYRRLFQKITRWDPYGYHRRALSIIEEIQPHIVHIHNDHETEDLVRRIRRRLPATRIVLHLHNEVREFRRHDGVPAYPGVDLCLGCSEYITAHYRSLIQSPRHQTLYNGVDTIRYRETARLRETGIYKRHGSDHVTVACYGRVSPEKGTDQFVELARLCKHDPRLRFICVGEISHHGKRAELYRQIRETMETHHLHNLEFLDVVPQDKMHLAYAQADIVVIPSRFEEPFCMVAIEAMAAGIPVIAAAKGGMREYLRHGENALLIQDNEPFAEQAKQHLNTLITDPRRQARLVENALQTVQRHFTWHHIAARLQTLYDAL